MNLVKIPHSRESYVNPQSIAFMKGTGASTRVYTRIFFQNGSEETVPCTPGELADAIENCRDSVADAIRDTFSDAFRAGNTTPAFLEAIAMALGYGPNGHESAFERISSALDAIAMSIGDYAQKE